MPSKHSSKGSAWEELRLTVLKRDGYICQHCGKGPLEGADATVDHIIAKASGGEDSLTNCIASCRRCNGIKSDKPLVRLAWFNPRWFAA